MPNLIIRNKVKLRRAIPDDAKLLCIWYADGRVMVHVGFANGLKEVRINRDCWIDPTGKSHSVVEVILIKNDFYNREKIV